MLVVSADFRCLCKARYGSVCISSPRTDGQGAGEVETGEGPEFNTHSLAERVSSRLSETPASKAERNMASP